MKVLKLKTQGEESHTRIEFVDSWQTIAGFLNESHSIIITDENLAGYYSSYLSEFEHIIIPAGEENKNLKNIQIILDALIELKADRDSMIVGLGGGVICDMAAFAASIFMRGAHLTLIPTSLLAMVDASVGGKTGVNYHSWKNLVGTFKQAEQIFIHLKFLETLPDREYHCGLAEAVKHAVIGDALMFQYLEDNVAAINQKRKDVVLNLVEHSIQFKWDIVEQDATENNIRRVLNFGHTFGHAIEKAQVYNHGESVAIGMLMAARISEIHHRSSNTNSRRIENLLSELRLNSIAQLDKEILLNNIQLDKKKSGDAIHFVFIKELGEAYTEKISYIKLGNYLDQL